MKILLFLFLLHFHFASSAQSIIVDDPDTNLSHSEREALRKKRVNYSTNKIGVIITPPSDFNLLNRSMEAPTNASSIDYAFINYDSTVIITIGLMARDSIDYEKDKETFKKFMPQFPNYEPNDQWIINFGATVDSSNFRPRIYTTKLLEKFNAEGGVEYVKKKSNNLYLNKYVLERTIILNKRFKGICEIHYFKVPSAKIRLEHEIKTAYKMIKYK